MPRFFHTHAWSNMFGGKRAKKWDQLYKFGTIELTFSDWPIFSRPYGSATIITYSEQFHWVFKIEHWFRRISEPIVTRFLNLWIRSNSESIFCFLSESEDNSEWITELAMNQNKSVPNVTVIRFWLPLLTKPIKNLQSSVGIGRFLSVILGNDSFWFFPIVFDR